MQQHLETLNTSFNFVSTSFGINPWQHKRRRQALEYLPRTRSGLNRGTAIRHPRVEKILTPSRLSLLSRIFQKRGMLHQVWTSLFFYFLCSTHLLSKVWFVVFIYWLAIWISMFKKLMMLWNVFRVFRIKNGAVGLKSRTRLPAYQRWRQVWKM